MVRVKDGQPVFGRAGGCLVADGGRSTMFDDRPRFTAAFARPTIGDWEEAARRSLGTRTLESLTVASHEGLAVKPLYTEADLPGPHLGALPRSATGWEVCCPVDLRDPETAIADMMTAVGLGATSFWLGVDRRKSSWGRLGATVLAEVLEASGGAPIYLDARAVTPALAAVTVAAAQRRGGAIADLRGGIDFDPLAALASNGTLSWNIDACFRIMAEMVQWSAANAPGLRTVAVSTLPYAKAGADAVQELAIVLATTAEYLRRLEKNGVDPGVGCRAIRLLLPVGRDLAIEACKLRAARLGWARLAEACGLAVPQREALVHAVTSPVCLTTRDPWVNLLRTSTQTYAAVVGCADVITVLPFDSALGRSDALAGRLALSTHTILREESHLGRVADPGHGSYYFERITHDLAAAAWALFQRIEAAGGMAIQLQSGAIARELSDSMTRKRRAVASRRDLITGVSSYPDLEEEPVARPRERRGSRPLPDDESTAVRRALGSAAASFPEVVASAAGGIVVKDLLELFPGHDEPAEMAPLPAHRDAEPFEHFRDASDRHRARTGARPHVFLAVVGSSPGERSAVAAATHLLASGGLTAVRGEGLEAPDDAAAAFEASGSRSAVVCAAEELVPKIARTLKSRGALRVLAVGRPGEHEQGWRDAGVDGFIHDAMDAPVVLADLYEIEGVARD